MQRGVGYGLFGVPQELMPVGYSGAAAKAVTESKERKSGSLLEWDFMAMETRGWFFGK
jgi:hypothetical protein